MRRVRKEVSAVAAPVALMNNTSGAQSHNLLPTGKSGLSKPGIAPVGIQNTQESGKPRKDSYAKVQPKRVN